MVKLWHFRRTDSAAAHKSKASYLRPSYVHFYNERGWNRFPLNKCFCAVTVRPRKPCRSRERTRDVPDLPTHLLSTDPSTHFSSIFPWQKRRASNTRQVVYRQKRRAFLAILVELRLRGCERIGRLVFFSWFSPGVLQFHLISIRIRDLRISNNKELEVCNRWRDAACSCYRKKLSLSLPKRAFLHFCIFNYWPSNHEFERDKMKLEHTSDKRETIRSTPCVVCYSV